MDLQRCYNDSEDTFPLPPHIKERYGPFGFPAPADARRPYITSNFVTGIDGKASFRELKVVPMATRFQEAEQIVG